jgi:hypothetical protein
MRPRPRTLALSLTLGLLTTLLIAWACSALATVLRPKVRFDIVLIDKQDRSFFANYSQYPGVEIYGWNQGGPGVSNFPNAFHLADRRAPSWSCIYDPAARDACLHGEWPASFIEWRAGWPMSALSGRLEPPPKTFDYLHPPRIVGGFLRFRDNKEHIYPAPNTSLNGYLFPLIPIWPGLLADTALFAAAWAFALIGLPHLRAVRRRRKKLCEHCAYDRHNIPHDSACPECGRPSTPAVEPAERATST